MDQVRPDRRRPPHCAPKLVPGDPVIIFLTVSADKRKAILATPETHRLIAASLAKAGLWRTGCYLIMPDHIHLFCSPTSLNAPPVNRWTQFWKSRASTQWPRPAEQPIWQRDCWDRQMRNAGDYAEKLEYVRQNPVRKGLVARPEDWPFQGQLNDLPWE